MIKNLGHFGMLATLAGACLLGTLSLGAQAQESGYNPPHVDTSGANMQPSYPSTAVAGGEQGSVGVGALVGSDGKVIKLTIEKSSGFDDLDNAALAAVKGWKFIPASRNGRYYETAKWATVKVDFRLPDWPKASGG